MCEKSRVQTRTARAGEENDQSEFKRVPGHCRFHVHGEDDGSNLCDLIHILGMRNDRGHVEGEAGGITRTKGNGEKFLGGS